MIKQTVSFGLTIVVAASLLTAGQVVGASTPSIGPENLAEGFRNPPDSARPWSWWMWLNGTETDAGVTADLEAMRRVGLRGALMMMPAMVAPGPIKFNTPPWYAMVNHAVREADRLGMTLGIHNCEGWSSSGGPWVQPSDAMQMLVWTEQRVSGPVPFAGVLQKPLTRCGHYEDIGVFAFPTPEIERLSLASFSPRVTDGAGKPLSSAALFDGNLDTRMALEQTGTQRQCSIQFECAKPFSAGVLRLVPGPACPAMVSTEIQTSDDGIAFRTLKRFDVNYVHSITDWLQSVDLGGARSRFFRLVFSSSMVELAEADIWAAPSHAAAEAIPRNAVVDLTAKMKPDGHLDWPAPAGSWTLLRIGHTAIGVKNHPASAEGIGLEVDKLSRTAFQSHFNALMDKVITGQGALAGKTLQFGHVDSYEIGPQNWTNRLPEAFHAQRGYDIGDLLPVMTGRSIDSPETTRRFRWDFQRTIGDLWSHNYYGYFAELLHARNMKLCSECYGVFTADDIACAGETDMPVTEFWLPGEMSERVKWSAAMAGHLKGRPIVGAEAFTSNDDGWEYDPYSIKALGDVQFCAGVSRFIVHNFSSQPDLDRKPGLSWPNGLYYNRSTTWWEQSRAWVDYVARCQFLLQQGRFVADVLSLASEDVSRFDLDSRVQRSPSGYDYDGCDRATFLDRITARNGRLMLPHGQSYALLALPDSTAMTLARARKVRELTKAGIPVAGPRPVVSPSLSEHGPGDAEVARIAGEIWEPAGKNVRGRTVAEALHAMGLKPDFEFASATARLNYIHRQDAAADWYFVANNIGRCEAVECVFRVSGKKPELWHPDTGIMEPAPVWRPTSDGRTSVAIPFEPCGSVFVVFREPAIGADPVIAVTYNGGPLAPPKHGKFEIRKALWGDLRTNQMVDVRDRAVALVQNGRLSLLSHEPFTSAFKGGGPRGLRIVYSVDGEEQEQVFKSPTPIDLPREVLEPAAAELSGQPNGAIELKAWKAGVYELEHASGKRERREIGSIPVPQTIAGPWTVSFDSVGLSAPSSPLPPATVSFERLASWTERAEPALKYYSGTAVYRKVFELDPAMKDSDKVLLDLGALSNVAEVALNGNPLGILWKPPFQVDATRALKPGHNELEVKVTNLWANRLMGDAGLPPERRITGSTFNPYPKNASPLSSGLLGPVVLRVARVLTVK